ncbi:hypothetical protein SAMN05216312_10177 [Cohnella sp. OV330]|uniref:hypothetical protein n=1 Tax=Cohnella sp. OV330 TaxID=1855288 RepID=UPI0008E131B0|nr:hypothetical protein [Cohnella sp. OV330]SFA71420.1 hypothetical protein SAMN05216312_10177 [Cohnella sp. OV330]
MDAKAQIEQFIDSQRREVRGMRREMLERDLYGTRILLSKLLLPVLKTLEGLELEYEVLSQNGVKLSADAFFKPLRHVYECEGFVPHVELMTRERHDFVQSRLRTFAAKRFIYVPFSRDELEKKTEACRRSLYEIIGEQTTSQQSSRLYLLPIVERELLRFALHVSNRFSLPSACQSLGIGESSARKHLRSLYDKRLLRSIGSGDRRLHYYQITDEGRACFY